MSRRPARAWEARPQIAGLTRTGATGLEVDQHGHLGPRTCGVCEFRLDDVDGAGTHPWCVPSVLGLREPAPGIPLADWAAAQARVAELAGGAA